MRSLFQLSLVVFGVCGIVYFYGSKSTKAPVETSFILDIPEDKSRKTSNVVSEAPDVEDETKAISTTTSSTDIVADREPQSLRISGDTEFVKEAERAVAMGIITKDEMAAYIQEHKTVAYEEQNRLNDEMSQSIDDELLAEKEF